MPSLLHELLVELFRNRPALARELLAACTSIEPAMGRAELASIDLSQIVPTEYRADAVTIIRDDERLARTAIIVEVQLNIDAAKRWTWPIYVAALRGRLRCPIILLVLTDDDRVRRWAREPIELGHPDFCLRPLVIAFDDVPAVTDELEATLSPELAVLSALAHATPAIAYAVKIGTLTSEEESRIRSMTDVVTLTTFIVAVVRATDAVEARRVLDELVRLP